MHTQLYNYLQSDKILSPYQCGFRKSYSTELTALCLADTIRRNIDLGQMTGAVYIDLRKAFDTVDHNLLLRKLSYIGGRTVSLTGLWTIYEIELKLWTIKVCYLILKKYQ